MTVLTQLFALPTDTLSIYSDGFIIVRHPVTMIDSMNFNPSYGKLTREEFLNAPTTALNNLVEWNLMETSSHDSFGLMAILHATDMMSEDIVMSILSHFRFDYAHDNINFNFRRPRMIWTYLYDVIKTSNKIIETAPSNSQNQEIKFTLGQAYALRGYAYLYLVQLFQHTAYEIVPANLLLPAIPLIYAQKEGKPNKTYRVPAQDVLTQVADDLLSAKQQLDGLIRPSKKFIDSNVVSGLLARYYLLTGQWTHAVDAARVAKQGYNVMNSTEIMDGFMDINNPEWMWGFDHNSETTSSYASFFSHISNLSSGYAGSEYGPRLIDKRLFETIPATDTRKGWFQNESGSIVVTQYVSEAATGWKLPYANLKFGWATGFTQDYLYMRASEMVLIEAEALAHQAGKGGEAATALMQLMSKRNPSWSQSSVTVDDVWRQRRIELWGEGFAYFDLKRLNKGIDRAYVGTNHEASNRLTVPAADKRWNYELPDIAFDEFPGLSIPNLLPIFNPITIINTTGTSMSYNCTLQNLNEQINYVKGLMYTTDPEFKTGIVSVNSTNYKNNGHADTIRSLIPETTYYCKLYYKSANGNVYSEGTTFNTIASILPQVTHTVTNISDTYIQVTGSYQFTSSITAPILEKGFDIALDSTLTTGHIRKTIENSSEATFDNLLKGTEYYVRAFAKTTDGFAYSPATKITTLEAIEVKGSAFIGQVILRADTMVWNAENMPDVYTTPNTGALANTPSFFSIHGVEIDGQKKHVLSVDDLRSVQGANGSFCFLNVLQNTANKAYIGSQRGYMFSNLLSSLLGGGTTGRQCDLYEIGGNAIRQANIDTTQFKIIAGSWLGADWNEARYKFVDSLFLVVNNEATTEAAKLRAYYQLGKIQTTLDNSTLGVAENPTNLGAQNFARRRTNAGTTGTYVMSENYRVGDYIILKNTKGGKLYYGIMQIVQMYDDTQTFVNVEGVGQKIGQEEAKQLFHKPLIINIKVQKQL